MRPVKLAVATRNAHKLDELASALPGIMLDAVDAGEVDEHGTTYEENALLKARAARRVAPADVWVAGEDSGIEAAALAGAPGIRSARWAADGVAALLEALADVEDRRIRYVCAIAAIGPDGTEIVVGGTLAGAAAATPRGEGGFGYDPIFVPEGESRTVAELGDAWKRCNSHRARAAALLAERLHLG